MTTRTLPTDCCRLENSVAQLGDAESARLVGIFKALGDATRLEVFRLIASQSQPVCVCDIAEHFDVSQPTISHHLKVLREAALITQSKRGIWSFYAATGDGAALLAQLGALLPVERAA